MQKKHKGYLALSLALGMVISACGSKQPPAVAPTPLASQVVESVNPNDIQIPGIDDIPADGTPTTDPGTPSTDVPTDTVPSGIDGTTDPNATATPDTTATTDPTVTATPTDAVSATPTATATSTVLTCEAKITGDLNVIAGSIRQLTAKNECSDGTVKTDAFTWTSSDTTIATVDGSGNVSGIKAGTVNITATSNVDSTKKSTVQFKVNATCSIALGGDLKNNPEVGLNSSKQLTAAISCNDGTTTSNNISWTTSDSSIATVNTSGLVQGLKKGNAKITATYGLDNSVTTSLDITVNDPNGNEQRATLAEGKLYQVRGIDVRNGQIYVSDYDKGGTFNLAEGQIQIVDSAGNVTKTIQGSTGSSMPSELNGIATDGGRVWVANRIPYAQSKNNVYSFSTAGTGRLDAALGLTGDAGTNFQDMAIDPSSSSLYIASAGLSSIIKVNYDSNGIKTDSQQMYFSGSTKISPAGIGVDSLGNVLVTNAATNPATIIKFGKGGEKALTFNSTGTNGTGPSVSAIGDIAADTNGNIYVSAVYNGSAIILRYDGDGKFIRSFGSGTMTDPRGIAVGADGTLYVADYAKGSIIQFGPGK